LAGVRRTYVVYSQAFLSKNGSILKEILKRRRYKIKTGMTMKGKRTAFKTKEHADSMNALKATPLSQRLFQSCFDSIRDGQRLHGQHEMK
jgi:hypothetical protein